jgi:tRNA dimethylallyltransferase
MDTSIADPQALHQKVTDFLASASRPLIVVLGTTASGKTALSIDLAKKLDAEGRGVEVINADSRQIYTQLDIGTAKITEQEMQGIPHHLLSVLDPKQELTIAWYQTEATKAIEEIHARGNIPMMVGGSMLYISSVIDGLEPLPASDPAIRQRLSDAYDADRGVTLMKILEEIDPEAAASIPRENKIYVMRALEIFELTGKPASQAKTKKGSPYDLFLVGALREREEIKERIQKRTEVMLEQGWAEEVKNLLERGYSETDPGMKSHGYRDLISYIKGELTLEALKKTINEQTQQYAKRQMTWWRDDPRITWVDVSTSSIRTS